MTAPSPVVPAARARHLRRRNTGPPDPNLVLLIASGAIFVSVLDFTIVNVALPALRADFPSASLPTLSWVVTAYGVMFAALLPMAGRLADVVGRQRLFVWSVAAFTVTSAFAAVAPNEGSLICFRALQGVAAAGMSPAALGLILTWTPRERLMTAVGVWAAAGSVAALIGPALGGALVETWSWRTIFLVNVPLGLAVIAGTVAKLRRDAPSGRLLPDPIGTVLLAVALGAVTLGLSQGSEWGWTSGSVLFALFGGLLGVGGSLLRSARHPAPALELDLWRDRTFTVATAATVIFSAPVFAFLVTSPLFLTEAWNYSVLKTGLALTPAAIASAVGAVGAGRWATTPTARLTAAVCGSLLLAAGCFFLWAQLGIKERFVEVFLPGSLAVGIGVGLALTALFGAGAASIPPSRFASGSGILTMTRQVGGALGVATTAAILAASGYSTAVDPFLAVYLFCGVIALVAGAASLGLPQPSPAAAVAVVGAAGSAEAAGDTEAAGSAEAAGR